MKAQTRDRSRIALLAASGSLVIIILLLAGFMSIAGAQQEPEKVPFEGTLVADAPGAMTMEVAPVNLDALGPEWRPIFAETFEAASWEQKWDVNLDFSGAGYKWGTRDVPNSLDPASKSVAWAIGGGTIGSTLDPLNRSYPSGVQSWLVAGPFDLSSADDALINLDLFYEASGGDPFTVSLSEDRIQFTPQLTVNKNVNKGDGQWEQRSVSLSAFAGKPQIWVAFTFTSTNSAQKFGALMDNVSVWVEGEPGTYLPVISYGFTPTPLPVTPTATPPPSGDYDKNFTNNIDGWEARRWTDGTSYDLSHDGGSDDGRQGFLNLLVNTKDSHYVIASPLVAGPEPPYNIETTVKLRSDRNTGDQYGIIFGGNYTGGPCPATDFSTCFTHYYELRIRFFYDSGLDKDKMEFKLKRIDSHDSNNNNSGPDLIEWTRLSSKLVDENGFIEWDVNVDSDGKIKIAANDEPVGSAKDTKYIDNLYFGVIVRTEDEPNAEAKYDYFKIEGY